MDTTYIVLDGVSSTLSADGSTLTWTIGDYFFKDLRSDERLKLRLIYGQYIGKITTIETSPITTSEVYANIKLLNQSDTYNNDGYSLLGIVDANIDVANSTASASVNSLKQPTFIINKFNEISIQCLHHGTTLDFTSHIDGVSQNYCKFVFEVSKINN